MDEPTHNECQGCGRKIHYKLNFCDDCMDEIEQMVDELEVAAVAFSGFFGE